MSDCLINIRIIVWHFQVSKRFKPSLRRNPYLDFGWKGVWLISKPEIIQGFIG